MPTETDAKDIIQRFISYICIGGIGAYSHSLFFLKHSYTYGLFVHLSNKVCYLPD